MNTSSNYKSMVMVFMLIFALSSFALTSSRSLKAIAYERLSTQQLYNDKFEKKERIDMQVQDYPGSGANNKDNKDCIVDGFNICNP
ncbi:hypothetical protein CASFOL_028032 [Castilleja foliolosa]|uniref:Uncharacterized protein n=1 Tax=Castilleja foliolosa TaxID=1961234 RepID=A0ABD3CGG0_9LAMI